ncbi:MAG TPA: hypothetical protein VFL83_22520 [Anaeromyxobacter sp.]|nr:hypothetical protein [Anaeromyxobacter sp.]
MSDPVRGRWLVALCCAGGILAARSAAAQDDFDIYVEAPSSPTRVAAPAGFAIFRLKTDPKPGTTAQAITLSVSGLPTGATATFFPASVVTAGSRSNLMVTPAAGTTPQSYPLTVTGTYPDGVTKHDVPLTLLVIEVPISCVPKKSPGWPYPDWWTPPFRFDDDTPFDDRWGEATAIDFARDEGSVETVRAAEIRALYREHPSALYFVWLINVDPSLGLLQQPSLYLGIAPGTAREDALIIRISLTETDSTVHDSPRVRKASDGALSVNLYKWTTAGWNPAVEPAPERAWIEATAGVWKRYGSSTSDNGDFTSIGGPEGAMGMNQWAVLLMIPIDPDPAKGVNVTPTSFRMWHYADLSASLPGDAAIPRTWPRTPQSGLTDFMYDFAFSSYLMPDPSNWGEFTTNTTSPGCTGITISGSNIGTHEATGQSYIDVTDPNTFFAKPTNTDGTPVSQNSLIATFRFANWGTQGFGDETDESWTSPPDLLGPDLGKKGPAVTGGEITGDWQLSTEWRCRFTGTGDDLVGRNGEPIPKLPSCGTSCPTPHPSDCCCQTTPDLSLHQCMLVKLRPAPEEPNVTFVRDSAIRNMDFVTIPEPGFERTAEISVKGLPDLPGGKRDVYLYVEALYMPKYALDFPSRMFTHGATATKASSARSDRTGGDGTTERDTPPGDSLPPTPAPDSRRLIVHAYHDTGQKVRTVNGERRLLFPQTSFGYVVQHQGPTEGWLWNIGAESVSGVPNLYKVSVPNGGAVQIQNVIEAVEPKRWSLALHGGVAFPLDTFGNTQGLGFPAVAVEGEYMITSGWATLAQVGLDYFPGKSGQSSATVYRLALNGKRYFLTGRFRPFVTAGASSYWLDSSSEFGFDVGGGGQLLLSHSFALELTGLYQEIRTSPKTTYVDVLLGLRYRF